MAIAVSGNHIKEERMETLAPLVLISVAALWLAAVGFASILYRQRAGKPIFPRAPAKAQFSEAWCSGHSQINLRTRLGGANNCLLVYVAEEQLHIVPLFPFTLMFLPEIYNLELTAHVSTVTVSSPKKTFGRTSIIISINGWQPKVFQLWLRTSPEALQAALRTQATTG